VTIFAGGVPWDFVIGLFRSRFQNEIEYRCPELTPSIAKACMTRNDGGAQQSQPLTFLTGATGLLSRYLIRDLLYAGDSVAVLVRPTAAESARFRVFLQSFITDIRKECNISSD
jgi:hypothetical protein